MTKYFCDICTAELPGEPECALTVHADRHIYRNHPLRISVTVSSPRTIEGGPDIDICKECAALAVKQMLGV